jgi:hypothetical protein
MIMEALWGGDSSNYIDDFLKLCGCADCFQVIFVDLILVYGNASISTSLALTVTTTDCHSKVIDNAEVQLVGFG